jgi:uncharacterized membrane protein
MGMTMEPSGSTSDGAAVPSGAAIAPDARPSPATAQRYQRIADDDRGTGGESLANFLGMFSLGLGIAQVVAPGAVSRVCGIAEADESTALMRALGLREISSGLAILGKQQPEKAMWSRVVGDVMDLALLGKALANPDNDRGRTLFATANVLAVTALDVMCAKQLAMQPRTAANAGADDGIIRTKRSITVRRPVEDVYAYWRDFENLPRFMRHLESVHVLGDGRSRWRAKAPGGGTVEWTATTTQDMPNELIAWRAEEGSDVWNAGTVRFEPAPRGGTEVRLEIEYDPPFGKLGSKVAMLFREEPGQQAQDDLRHFKQMMEVGEIVVSDATKARGPHPARPDGRGVTL